MDKQKQIEEMAQCLNSYGYVCGDCNLKGACERYQLSKELWALGYRKIPEGAVALTGTEAEERLEDLLIEFDEMSFYPATLVPNAEECAREWKGKLIYAIGQLRKETTEKFAERLKNRFKKSREYYSVDTGTAWSDGCIGGLINDTIDEILKEIKEGKL